MAFSFGSAATSFGTATAAAAADYDLPSPPDDSVSELRWSPTANILAVGSWDGGVRAYEVQQQGSSFQAAPKAMIKHDKPVLSIGWSADGSTVFSGSADKTVKMWKLAGPAEGQVVAQHDAPIQSVHHIQELNCIATTSWDKTIKFWDMRTSNPVAQVQLPERAYAADVKHPLMVVATASPDGSSQPVVVINLAQPNQIQQVMNSPLKRQTRCITCFNDKSGYALASIEGRVGVCYVDPARHARDTFSFKCHRNGTDIYPVNDIHVNPKWGTFATVGADGGFNFWDKDSKQRLKQSAPTGIPFTAGNFNTPGDIFAYAVGYDWFQGASGFNSTKHKTRIALHYTPASEIQSRPKKKK